jgi:transposase InsO family protein
MTAEISAVHRGSRSTYGSPRVHAELQAQGHTVSRNRVARLMRLEGLQARRKRRFRTTTDSRHDLPIAPNELARDFEVGAPNVAWVTDITYVWTREGWLYLAALLDLFSRRVVGWATSDSLSTQLALNALAMALRGP